MEKLGKGQGKNVRLTEEGAIVRFLDSQGEVILTVQYELTGSGQMPVLAVKALGSRGSIQGGFQVLV